MGVVFPALSISCMFSRTLHRLHDLDFPAHLKGLPSHFPALRMHRMHACSPTHPASYMFLTFLRSLSITCFPELLVS